MPAVTARKPRTPSYRLHKASGQAIVTLSGRMIYLGKFGSTESKTEYDRILSEYLAAGRQHPGPAHPDMTVSELIVRYWAHAEVYHAGESGRGDRKSIKLMLAILRRLYGHIPARDFGAKSFRAVRDGFVAAGWSRKYCNAQGNRLRRMWSWAAEMELVPAGIAAALREVKGLRFGKTTAPEVEPIKPVPESVVEATLPHCSPQVAAMIQVQILTGMRPGELVIMRGADLAAPTEGPWTYIPDRHKNQHRRHVRTVFIGPRAQAVIGPLLKSRPELHIFSPADVELERRQEQHAARTTPMSCGNTPGSNVRRGRRRRLAGDRYTVDSYRRAITRACDEAFPPPAHLARQKVAGTKGRRWETIAEWKVRIGDAAWQELVSWRNSHRWHPHQLRHTRATALRAMFTLEAAQAVLGHADLSATQIYAEKDLATAARIMGQVG